VGMEIIVHGVIFKVIGLGNMNVIDWTCNTGRINEKFIYNVSGEIFHVGHFKD
jgi:hypothetical protein